MRRPNLIHLVTKGIGAIRKSISLITKGIIDQKIGGKAIPSAVEILLDTFYDIVGIKSFAFELDYEVVGKRIDKITIALVLVGKKQAPIEVAYLIKAIREKELESILQLAGRKTFELEKRFDFQGDKQFELSQELILAGQKKFDFGFNKLITAKRQCPIREDKELIGSKIIDIDNTLSISGKRDRTSIFVALDLI